MRPIKIEFQAFGPYKNHEIVDFEAISSKGLFLICGKTGIGKTTILDAMTFALYGKSSGHGRDDFEAMRCTNADYEKTTFVKFVFENQGEYYTFERKLERKRKNLSPSYNVFRREDGIWRPLLENARVNELNKLAEELIGLEYEQFRQVIVLPQGQFEKLLTSNSDEKEKILTSIFGEEKWAEIAKKMFEEASSRKDALEKIRDNINARLMEDNCENLSDLEYMIQHAKDGLKETEEELKKEDFDTKSAALLAQLKLVNSFKDLHDKEGKLEKLNKNRQIRDGWENTANVASKAEKVREFIKYYDDADRALKDRITDENKASENRDYKEKLLKNAEGELNRLKEAEKEYEEKNKLKIEYSGKLNDYENVDKAKGEIGKLKETLKSFEEKTKKAQQKYDSFASIISQNNEDYIALDLKHKLLLEVYLAGITGELASKLKEGEACPVCGSKEHPQKAKIAENNVSKKEVDDKKKQADDMYQTMNDNIKLQDEAKKIFEKVKKEKEEADRLFIEKQSMIHTLQKNLVEGIDSAKDLEGVIKKLDKEIGDYQSAKSNAENAKNDAAKNLSSADAELRASTGEKKKAEDKFNDAKDKLQKALEENGFDDVDTVRNNLFPAEDIKELRQKVSEYDANVASYNEQIENLKKELKEKQEPDEKLCESELKDIDKKKEEYSNKKTTFNNEIERLTKKLDSLKKDSEGLNEKIATASEDVVFAKKLRGDSGTGIQRYVLGIMFSSVIAAANQMLEMVHGGRYRLFRSDDKVQGTNKRGLDLKVLDSHSDDKNGRFVGTLSGGEKFLASLALSIGMSTIAQKSGIKIEALFIDEGFGSLDEDSIGDAMNILNSIQEANGLVGIISHVQILQDRIPSKLVVEREGNGSHIVQTIG